jgi:hypothetical protein
LIFSGFLHDINIALNSLVYRPFHNWNSLQIKNTFQSTIQLLRIQTLSWNENYYLTTFIRGPGTIITNSSSFFQLRLYCSKFLLENFNFNGNVENSTVLNTNIEIVTEKLMINISATMLQIELESLFAKCLNHSINATVSVLVHRNDDLNQNENFNVFTWEIKPLNSFLRNPLSYITIDSYSIISSSTVGIPYIQWSPGDTKSSTIDGNMITYQLGYDNEWTESISMYDSAEVIKLKLERLSSIFTVQVIRTIHYLYRTPDSSSDSNIIIEYELIFDYDINLIWSSSFYDSTASSFTMKKSRYSFGPMVSLELNRSGLMDYPVDINIFMITQGTSLY